MTQYLRCWCCRQEMNLVGHCACTKGECPRGDHCMKRET